MKSGQKGFTVIELLLVLILVSILGFTGYYVYSTRNKADSTYNTATKNASSTSQNTDTANWQTYSGKADSNASASPTDDDEVSYTFKYPSDWKFYPIGSTDPRSGSEGTTSFQQITDGEVSSSISIKFNSTATKLNASDYSKNVLGNQSNLVGPTWQNFKSFTTTKGYSGHTVKLESSYGTAYDTFISNSESGVVDFNYGQEVVAKQNTILQAIFDSVDIP